MNHLCVWFYDYNVHFVQIVCISSTLCCVESSNLTSCRSLLISETLLFPSTLLSTTSEPLGPHLCSSLLGVELGERQRVGAIPAGSALPLDGDCKLVAARLTCCGAGGSALWDSGWTSICTSKVGLGDLWVAGLDPTHWCWNIAWLFSWKKYREWVNRLFVMTDTPWKKEKTWLVYYYGYF